MPNSASHDATTNAAPAVAVVIPFYNGSPFIERALRSVVAQTMPAAEVVVVNDGSEPQEREFLHALQPRYGFTLIDQPNSGQGAARNAGVAAASAPYICFLDQDDFYLEHHIRILVEAIPPDDPRLGYIYGDLWEADGNGDIIRNTMVKGPSAHPKTDLANMLRYDLFVLPSASLIRRTAFEAVGGFDTQFTGYEDDDLFLRIFRAGYTNYFVDRAVTVWCVHTGSTTFGMGMVRSCLLYFKKLAAMFPDEPRHNRHFLRDCLIPRFREHFLIYVIKTAQAGDVNHAEMRAILDEYIAVVRANQNMGSLAKFKLRVAITLAQLSPPWLIRALYRHIHSRPIRLLRRLLWL